MELNGWDLDAFQATAQEVDRNPQAGHVTWRGTAEWHSAFGVDARADEIEQMGNVIRRRFTMRGDHPPELLGENTGPTAVETLLAALGSCIAGTYAAHATAQGITVRALHVDVESDVDLAGFLQLRDVPAGLNATRVRISVDADADDATLEELAQVVTRASPVYHSVTRPTVVDMAVERSRPAAVSAA